MDKHNYKEYGTFMICWYLEPLIKSIYKTIFKCIVDNTLSGVVLEKYMLFLVAQQKWYDNVVDHVASAYFECGH